ncbi:hypothetical protein Lcho_2288 [Leptothrix cholodnii SP-6]|uniref:Uncharacterized protein n=1 Tax=Leptothrix cholodnii (strain ATCC 51168 / LMG 8142 / SP-6) TaxID=395495 RepID=B1Y432_LEPCP|nr:hypothetical protein [Leptothrix cholodnii]ACB34554.1 hypothetical protein Lcho_2288 [Leptothrix cholodnii SP-6]
MPRTAISDRELLEWMLQQDQLRIEKWHHPGGKQSVSVWTNLDDDDAPSGVATTARGALVMAIQHQRSLS